jgi:hypothetical protein
MAMLMQSQQLNNKRLYQFFLVQIVDYGRGILGDG